MTRAQQQQHEATIAHLVEFSAGLPLDALCAAFLRVIEAHPNADEGEMQKLGQQLERAPQMRAHGLPLTYGMKALEGVL